MVLDWGEGVGESGSGSARKGCEKNSSKEMRSMEFRFRSCKAQACSVKISLANMPTSELAKKSAAWCCDHPLDIGDPSECKVLPGPLHI